MAVLLSFELVYFPERSLLFICAFMEKKDVWVFVSCTNFAVLGWGWWWAITLQKHRICAIESLSGTVLKAEKTQKLKLILKTKSNLISGLQQYARAWRAWRERGTVHFFIMEFFSCAKKRSDFISLMLLKFHYYNANNHTSLWATQHCVLLSTHIVQRKHFQKFSMFTTSARKLV